MTKLLLVDGSAILHRAYHAYPPLTAPDGSTVGAVYGVISILLTVIKSLAPTHLAVAWDLPAPTFRHEKYVGYKAQRPKAEVEMVEQIAVVKKLIEVMGWRQVEAIGYEGDDIIGSLAKQLSPQADETIILTGDQDTMQLVAPKVMVMLPPKGKEPSKIYGEREVVARYGVSPDRIVDYKALVGDSSDNIPGVAGIGPKTASELVQQYGSLDNIYENLDKIGEKIRAKLVSGKDSAYLSYELSRIVLEMDLGIALDDLLLATEYKEEVKASLQELGFVSLIKRIFGENKPVVKPKSPQVSADQMGLF